MCFPAPIAFGKVGEFEAFDEGVRDLLRVGEGFLDALHRPHLLLVREREGDGRDLRHEPDCLQARLVFLTVEFRPVLDSQFVKDGQDLRLPNLMNGQRALSAISESEGDGSCFGCLVHWM